MPGLALRGALIAVATTLVVATAPNATAAGLRHGLYDCYDGTHLAVKYVGSMKLRAHHVYLTARKRHGTHLVRPTHGRYHLSGTRVHFTGARFDGEVGHVTTSGGGGTPHLVLYRNGRSTRVSCSLVT